MSSAIDLESGQGAKDAQCAGTFCSRSHQSPHLEVLMGHEEGAGGSDSELPVREAVEAQPVVLQVETVDETSSSTSSGCCIPNGASRPYTLTRGRNNIVSKHNVNSTTGGQPAQAGQRLSQAEAQIRACFATIVETSMT